MGVGPSEVGRRQINGRAGVYAAPEARRVTEPHLPLAGGSLDRDPTRVNLGWLDVLAAEAARAPRDLHCGLAAESVEDAHGFVLPGRERRTHATASRAIVGPAAPPRARGGEGESARLHWARRAC